MIFKKAKKIFPSGMRGINNVFAGFYRPFNLSSIQEPVKVKITARSFYKIYMNGAFVFYGPARAAHEHSRVDEIDATPYMHIGINHFAFEVICYTKSALAATGEYGFLAAEITAGETILDYTNDSWHSFIIEAKLRNTRLFGCAIQHGSI